MKTEITAYPHVSEVYKARCERWTDGEMLMITDTIKARTWGLPVEWAINIDRARFERQELLTAINGLLRDIENGAGISFTAISAAEAAVSRAEAINE